MEWHWPKNLEELTRLLREEGALIHAGGTAIREERIKSAVHVIDMSCLPLNYVKKQDGVWHIGATAVLNDVIDVFEGAQAVSYTHLDVYKRQDGKEDGCRKENEADDHLFAC